MVSDTVGFCRLLPGFCRLWVKKLPKHCCTQQNWGFFGHNPGAGYPFPCSYSCEDSFLAVGWKIALIPPHSLMWGPLWAPQQHQPCRLGVWGICPGLWAVVCRRMTASTASTQPPLSLKDIESQAWFSSMLTVLACHYLRWTVGGLLDLRSSKVSYKCDAGARCFVCMFYFCPLSSTAPKRFRDTL